MANNIFQQAITPVKPKSLAQERVFVYVEEATVNTKGIASFEQDDFIVNNGHVVLNTASLSRTPFDKFSLIKLDKNDFVLTKDFVTQVNWPYAHLNGHENTNGAGLIKIAPDSIGYLKFTNDENNYLEVDIGKLNIDLELPTKFDDITKQLSDLDDKKLDRRFTSLSTNNGIANDIFGITMESEDGLLHAGISASATNGILLGHIRNGYGDGNSLILTNAKTQYSLSSQNHIDNVSIDILPTSVEVMVEDSMNSSIINVTSNSFTYNGDDIVTRMYVDNKVSNINAIMIRNKEPNLVVEATINTVATVATDYIQTNYGRAPITNDGLLITLTDKDDDVVKYAFYNGAWVNIGLNNVDLSNYVDISSTQLITGNKNFTGNLMSNGVRVATENDVVNLNDKIETNISKALLIGADGIIEDSNIIFQVQDAASFDEFLTNQRRFLTSLYLPVVGKVDDNLTIRIEFGDTVYNLYSFLTGGNTPLTFKDLKSVTTYNEDLGYSSYPTIIFIRNSEYTGFVIDPATITAAQLANLDISGGSVNIDNVSITENTNGEIQAVALKNGLKVINDNSISNENFSGVTNLTQAQFEQLTKNGSIVVNGQTIVYDPNHIYITTDNVLQDLTLIQSNMMLISEEEITGHVHVMLEFETNGVHYGTDFILHPYDTSICLVSFRFNNYDSSAYLDDSGKINIIIPDGLTFTNVKAHYISLGG